MINDRQIKLLNAIISEYINTAEPVGSVEIVKKYNFKFSPATARNEMARLLEEGFLQMINTSSGRVPTPMAYRFFLDTLLEEDEIPVLQEVAMKQRLWPDRFEFDKLIKNTVVTLAENLQELSFVLSHENYIFLSGLVNILDHKEFWDIDVAKTALYVLDRPELLKEIIAKSRYGNDVKTVIGDEMEIENLLDCSLVFAPFQAGTKSGYVGVFGPARLKYESVIPAVRYAKNLIEELGESW